MQRRAASLIVSLLLAVGIGHLVGCSNSVKPPHRPPPLDPETELTYAPVENDTTTFRVRFYWNGYDRDGEVVRFYFAVDADSLKPIPEWRSTTAKDTTFLFLVDPVKEIRGHVFMISAVDDKGAYDKTPARRFFSAKSIPPFSQIEKGPAAFNPQVGPNFTFEWSGIDPDGSETGGKAPVDSFEYLLLLVGSFSSPGHQPLPQYDQAVYVSLINQATGPTLQPPYDDWAWVGIRGLKNRFRNATPGEYVFAERAVDLAGATEKNLRFITNIRHFSVSTKNPGPKLSVSSSVLTLPLAPTSGPDDAPRKALQIFEGETISFSWTADASAYGGEIVGYTYALDDTSSFPGLDLLRTGATFAPSRLLPGNHFLYVRVVDDGGLVTNAVIPIQIVHPAFKDPGAQRSILYVDDSLAPGATPQRVGNFPDDVTESNWWTLDLLPTVKLGGTPVPTLEWDTLAKGAGDVEGRKPPEPKDLASFTTVIWNVDFNNGGAINTGNGLWKTLVGGSYSELGGYLRAGGTLILTGFNIGGNTCRPTTTLYSNVNRGICFALDPGSDAVKLSYFPRLFMGVDGAILNNDGLRAIGARDFISAYPTAAGIAAGYDTAQVDRGPLNSGAKWITYPGSGDPNTNSSPGLPSVDGWIMARNFGCEDQPAAVFRPENPNLPIAQVIYTYHGARIGVTEQGGPSPREGRVVGIMTQAHGLGTTAGTGTFNPNGSLGRMVHLAFPLYFLRDADAQRIIQTAFAYVNASPTLP
ncbi:MAG: hypothetical protein E6K79_11130 [Candidatus Eisenbacteria bacterium]|uniref:Uncharacterized protein n=1 Tax=Eiseniibacteriota bacterium TaxID=2212470 RepID=A0A538TH69_UNCEI|nr:MAG: hypothetical protein E6K79_11130 [Candidatus Eisenbacteria bacterium]